MANFDELRSRLLAKIDDLERQRATIQEELKAIDLVEKAAISVGLAEKGQVDASAGAAPGPAPAPAPAPAPVSAPTVKKEAKLIPPDRPTFELGEKDAILAVLGTFEKPLDPEKIADELCAVGYSFGDRNPVASVEMTIQELISQGVIVQVADQGYGLKTG